MSTPPAWSIGVRSSAIRRELMRRETELDRSEKRGTPGHPCFECRQDDKGSTLEYGFDRCNTCGYPGK